MEEHIASLVLLGVISWTTAFLFIRKMFPKRSFDFCNRLVSTIHATVAVTLASLSVEDWKCPVCPQASTSSPQQVYFFHLLLCIFLAFIWFLLLKLHILILWWIFILNGEWADESTRREPFVSHLWSGVLPLWQEIQSWQLRPPFGQHCWDWSRPCLPKGKQNKLVNLSRWHFLV